MQPAPTQPVTNGADGSRIAVSSETTWQGIDAALSPVIGRLGVAALYKRSLYLARAAHPGLNSVYEDELVPGNYTVLQAALSALAGTEAAAASDALLKTFHDLLGKLIGAPLTEQLLKSALVTAPHDHPSGGQTAQDTSR